MPTSTIFFLKHPLSSWRHCKLPKPIMTQNHVWITENFGALLEDEVSKVIIMSTTSCINCVQVLHFKSLISLGSFQLLNFNSYILVPSCQFFHFNSLNSIHLLPSIHLFQPIHVKSCVSIRSLQCILFTLLRGKVRPHRNETLYLAAFFGVKFL